MTNSLEFKVTETGIAHVIFNDPKEKVNKLSSKTLLELEKNIAKAKIDDKVKALVFSSKKDDVFIAGADINEIKDITDKNDAIDKVSQGQKIFNKIEDLPFPTICLINGSCMGGGLELALSCSYRVVTDNPKTKLALPEVSLGILPGFGGTQRLPKLIGLAQGLNIILSGKPVNAKKAYKIGLADELFREEFSEKYLNNFVDLILQRPKRNKYILKRNSDQRSRFTKETIFLGKYFIYKFARKNLLEKTKGFYPAPLKALKVVEETYDFRKEQRDACLKIEAQGFSELVTGKISKNLIDLFFISQELKKDSGIDGKTKPVEIKKAGLLGAGIMGGGIAWLFSNYDIPIRMKDISHQGIALGFKQVNKIYSQLKKIRKYDDNQISLKTNNISATTTNEGFQDRDIIVEAVIEDIKIKQNVLSDIEKHVKKEAIIASNTSSLPISKIGSTLKDPKRFVGMHFFNPVNRMPLVEVICGDKTSQKTVATIVQLSKNLGKAPIVVKDVPGFLVNRILLPYINESGFLIEEGAQLELVDELIENFGMPMGPFTLADVVGIDVGYKVAKILEKGYGNRMQVCDLLEEMAKNHDILGKKSSQGFYLYDKKGKKSGINPKIIQIIENNGLTKLEFFEEDVIDRCILIMVNEAAKCLEEKVVKSPRHLDMAMIMGTGFPPFRGGLLKYADNIGIKQITSRLKELSKKCGKRFTPAKLLIDMAQENKTFY